MKNLSFKDLCQISGGLGEEFEDIGSPVYFALGITASLGVAWCYKAVRFELELNRAEKLHERIQSLIDSGYLPKLKTIRREDLPKAGSEFVATFDGDKMKIYNKTISIEFSI